MEGLNKKPTEKSPLFYKEKIEDAPTTDEEADLIEEGLANDNIAIQKVATSAIWNLSGYDATRLYRHK